MLKILGAQLKRNSSFSKSLGNVSSLVGNFKPSTYQSKINVHFMIFKFIDKNMIRNILVYLFRINNYDIKILGY